VLQNKEYAKFYRKVSENGEFVILDNSVIELGHPMLPSELSRAVEVVHPSEMVMADFPGKPEETYTWAEQYGPVFKARYPKMRLMTVPQVDPDHEYAPGVSNSVIDWLASLRELSSLQCVDTIGIPKFLGRHRHTVCEEIQIGSFYMDKQYHLLGTSGNPIEVKDLAKDFPWIRGIDSKAPVRAGLAGAAFHPQYGLLVRREGLPPLDFDEDHDPLPVITHYNVKTFITWATPTNLTAEILRLRQ
jgi:hypothetical protein